MRKYEFEYEKYKDDYQDYIVLLKKGNRYITYMVDALIISELYNMEMTSFELIISIREMDDIKKILDNKNINYIIYDKEDIIKKVYCNNSYNTIMEDLKKQKLERSLIM